jgi:hypothetical protein
VLIDQRLSLEAPLNPGTNFDLPDCHLWAWVISSIDVTPVKILIYNRKVIRKDRAVSE